MANTVLTRRRGRPDVDMTEGNILRHLIGFALPLLVGNVFQQLYNTVDAWVVGNYVSKEAFSAVGTVGPIINTLIGFFSGLATGAGVVISQYYGAKKEDKVKDTVHTAAVMTLVLAAAFTALGLLMIDPMLSLTNTPDDVFPESRAYLTIYFAGLAGLMIYNMGAGILRAVGDSRRPFYYLVASAVVNIVLDLVFVLVFHMGVEGVAWATIISEAVSAILVLITLFRYPSCVRLRAKELRVDWPLLGKIIRVGIPAAIQLAITAFSNVFVQGYINYFGSDVMAGWTAYSKIDQVIFLPMQSLALAATTFVGQNLGNGRLDRAKKGVRVALLTAIAGTVLMAVPIIAFAPAFTAFFNDDPNVIAYGALFLRCLSPFYVTSCVNQVYAGALRGAGNSRAPMFILLGGFVAFRQLYLYLMANFICNEPLPIGMSYPAGWIACSIAMFIYYHVVPLDRTRLIDRAPTPPEA